MGLVGASFGLDTLVMVSMGGRSFWAHQGLFSALPHLLVVLVGGRSFRAYEGLFRPWYSSINGVNKRPVFSCASRSILALIHYY